MAESKPYDLPMEKLTAVLTGDFVGSTEADPDRLERSMVVLAYQAALIGSDTRFTRFRGDGWQIYLAKPSLFLWVTVYLNAVLKSDPFGSLPSRIAIGTGRVDRLGPIGLSAASGTAFFHSGRALDAMDRNGQTIALAGEGTDDIQRIAIAFIEERIAKWSPEQAEAVRLRMNRKEFTTQGKMAADFGITRQAVAARLQAAGYSLIDAAIGAFHSRYYEYEVTDV